MSNYPKRIFLAIKYIYLRGEISFDNWLYNGEESKKRPADLGYYIGYEICKAYYENSKDKPKALIEIIELNWQDKNKLLYMLELAMKKNGL